MTVSPVDFRLDFGRLMGLYIRVFFLVSQVGGGPILMASRYIWDRGASPSVISGWNARRRRVEFGPVDLSLRDTARLVGPESRNSPL